MRRYCIKYAALSGKLAPPPSKSHTLRAILFASLAKGTSCIRNYLTSPDTQAMITACRQLGAEIQQADAHLQIKGVAGQPQCPADVIDAGNSGQVLRFFGAVASLVDGYTVITGDHSIRFNRLLVPLMQGLSGLGVQCISTKGDGHAPLIVKGPMSPGHTRLEGADSQPVSGLLIAAAFLKGETVITVKNPGEIPWVKLTLDWFDRLGITYTHTPDFDGYTVIGGECPSGFDYTVPSDFSSLAYPLVAALITRSTITITGLDRADSQGDKKIIDVLSTMGADFCCEGTSLLVKSSDQLVGCDIDVNDFIDALPILAVLGCYAKGTTRLLNAGIARCKESDRLAAIAEELRKMGAYIDVQPDSLAVQATPLTAADMVSHSDHRIALSLAVAAMGVPTGTSTIEGVGCVAKSYPDFVGAMQSLGADIWGE